MCFVSYKMAVKSCLVLVLNDAVSPNPLATPSKQLAIMASYVRREPITTSTVLARRALHRGSHSVPNAIQIQSPRFMKPLHMRSTSLTPLHSQATLGSGCRTNTCCTEHVRTPYPFDVLPLTREYDKADAASARIRCRAIQETPRSSDISDTTSLKTPQIDEILKHLYLDVSSSTSPSSGHSPTSHASSHRSTDMLIPSALALPPPRTGPATTASSSRADATAAAAATARPTTLFLPTRIPTLKRRRNGIVEVKLASPMHGSTCALPGCSCQQSRKTKSDDWMMEGDARARRKSEKRERKMRKDSVNANGKLAWWKRRVSYAGL